MTAGAILSWVLVGFGMGLLVEPITMHVWRCLSHARKARRRYRRNAPRPFTGEHVDDDI